MGGVVVLSGMAAARGAPRTVLLLTGLEWIVLLLSGTVGGAGVLLLWSWATEYASAGRIAVFVTTTAISAAIVGALVLSEPIMLQLVSGTGLIVAGIYLVRQSGSGAPVSKRAFRS
jgi:drug/metabolite transporter (DMT)-like permease